MAVGFPLGELGLSDDCSQFCLLKVVCAAPNGTGMVFDIDRA
jgi:hypothetical protein